MNLRNYVQLIGNVGNSPVIKSLPNGNMMARFSVATSEYINENGSLKTKTEWHNVVAWGKNAKAIEKKCNKGTEVVINGKLVNRSYEDNSGNKRYITEVVVNEIICRPNKTENKIESLQ
jgi:single-strand DNA-binding protein